jgi:sugar phosphate isomerase/epimerase
LSGFHKQYAAHGIRFGWHNHDFEFVALGDGGMPMEILLDNAPEISWEADLAWIARAGRDPLDYVRRYANRLTSVHVKDIAPEGTNLDEDGWCDLGAGVMDWPALMQACRDQSSDLIYALEHDKPADPVRFANNSAIAFNTMWDNTHG